MRDAHGVRGAARCCEGAVWPFDHVLRAGAPSTGQAAAADEGPDALDRVGEVPEKGEGWVELAWWPDLMRHLVGLKAQF